MENNMEELQFHPEEVRMMEPGLWMAYGKHFPVCPDYDFAPGKSEAEARTEYDLKMNRIAKMISDYAELDKKYAEEIKPFLKQFKEAKEILAGIIGFDNYVQDKEGTVYKIVEPKGMFVEFQRVTVERTRRADEEKGTLSIKDAESKGFVLPEAVSARKSKK